MLRAFLAIDLPASYQAGLTAVQEALKKSGADVSWTKVGNIHLTLKFFGDIAEDQVQAIGEAVRWVARSTPVLTLEVQGLGTFPSPRNPRVIWLGLAGQTGLLADLAQNLEEALAPLGFPPEKRRFTPHLTLGRVRSSRGKEALGRGLQSLLLPDFPAFPVQELVFYRSTLRPQGALYTPLQRLPLGRDG